tara:strand:- start:481 stop:858 length:378 start_codon:yes stop_codon:yes gene_type:complete
LFFTTDDFGDPDSLVNKVLLESKLHDFVVDTHFFLRNFKTYLRETAFSYAMVIIDSKGVANVDEYIHVSRYHHPMAPIIVLTDTIGSDPSITYCLRSEAPDILMDLIREKYPAEKDRGYSSYAIY